MEALESSEAAILDRAIRPEIGGWPSTAAQAILGVGLAPEDRERMEQLMGKAKAGELSPAETQAMENYR